MAKNTGKARVGGKVGKVRKAPVRYRVMAMVGYNATNGMAGKVVCMADDMTERQAMTERLRWDGQHGYMAAWVEEQEAVSIDDLRVEMERCEVLLGEVAMSAPYTTDVLDARDAYETAALAYRTAKAGA